MSTTLPGYRVGMLPRVREDYNSKKWAYINRYLVPPSYSRSHLSENLATSFESEEQREKWLQMSMGSTASPSRVPPEGITRYNSAASEKKKEVFVENKASFYRIKSCPPDYILNPRYYKNMIRRNKAFDTKSKSILLSRHDHRMPTGETYQSFLLGARYADTKFWSGVSNRCDHEIERLAQQMQTLPESGPAKVATKTRSGRLYPSKRTQTSNEALRGALTQRNEPTPSRPTQLPGSASTRRKSSAEKLRQPGKHTPSPIAVVSTNSSAYRTPRPLMVCGESPASSYIELPLETSLAPSKESAMAEPCVSSSGKSGKQELEDDLKQDSLAKDDQENYFISPEARKLAGKILEESQLEADEKYSSPEDVETGGEPEQEAPLQTPGPATKPSDAPVLPNTPPAVEPVGTVRGSGMSTNSGTSLATDETNMASKSSTIFVDMSNLKVQEDR